MSYKEPYRKLSINKKLCQALDQCRQAEGRHGSLTLFVMDILGWYVQGSLTRKEFEPKSEGLITATKIESKTIQNERAKAS